MKKCLIIFITAIILLTSCGENKETPKISKELKPDTLMTVEKYAQMDFELASTLFNNYYEKLKDKEYKEVKDIYESFLNAKAAIYQKYNVKDPKKTHLWAQKKNVELKTYRESHPEINYFKQFSEFKEANILLYNLAKAEYKAKQK